MKANRFEKLRAIFKVLQLRKFRLCQQNQDEPRLRAYEPGDRLLRSIISFSFVTRLEWSSLSCKSTAFSAHFRAAERSPFFSRASAFRKYPWHNNSERFLSQIRLTLE